MHRLSVSFLLFLLHPPVAAQDVPAPWRLAARPSLALGREGDPRTRFLRIGAVLRLPGGEIVVANQGTSEIRIFDRTGRYLRALGRAGPGPGEFRSLSLVARAGETLFVADRINARLTEFLLDGTLVRTIPITARDAARFSVVGRFRDGRWAVMTSSTPSLDGPQRTYRDTASVGIIAPDASGAVVWIGSFPGSTFFVYDPTDALRGDVVAPIPIAPTAVSAMSGDEILIGDTGANVIGAYSSAGAVLRLIEVPLPASPLTDARIALLRQQALALTPNQRALPFLTALYSRAVLGQTLPVFQSMVVAPDGSIWVQPYPADPAEPLSWLVLDSSGKPLASVPVPAGFVITEVGPGYVVGIHTDAEGIETVRLYRLTR